MMDIDDLKFIKEIDALKTIERQTSIFNAGRRENSAEHSWHLSAAVFALKSFSKAPLNLEKALLLAIFHDVVEIDAGDTFVYANLDNKANEEFKTLERLMSLLPDHPAEELKSIWLEYEENITNEAKFVNALDRFLPIFANYLSKGFSWKKHQIKKSQVIDRNKEKIVKGLPELWPVVEIIMNQAIAEGYLIDQ